MTFTVHADVAGWRVTNGALAFGPYSTHAKAEDAAQSLSRTYARVNGRPVEAASNAGSPVGAPQPGTCS